MFLNSKQHKVEGDIEMQVAVVDTPPILYQEFQPLISIKYESDHVAHSHLFTLINAIDYAVSVKFVRSAKVSRVILDEALQFDSSLIKHMVLVGED